MKIVPVIKSSDLDGRFASTQKFLISSGNGKMKPSARGPMEWRIWKRMAELLLSRHAGDGVFGSVNRVFVESVDDRYATFRARGLDTTLRPESPIHTAPVDQTWGLREFAVTDPDGNGLCFCAPIR